MEQKCAEIEWGSTMKKPPDERATLTDAVHQLREQIGARCAAHVLYNTARTLTLEADRQAMADRPDTGRNE